MSGSRYPNDGSGTLPGPGSFPWPVLRARELVQMWASQASRRRHAFQRAVQPTESRATSPSLVTNESSFREGAALARLCVIEVSIVDRRHENQFRIGVVKDSLQRVDNFDVRECVSSFRRSFRCRALENRGELKVLRQCFDEWYVKDWVEMTR